MHERDGRGIRVLVTGGAHTASLAAVRALRAAGYEPWVGAASDRGYAARSRAAAGTVVLPDAGSDQQGFIDQLAAAVKRLGIRVLIPGTEPDLIAIACSSDSSLRAIAGLPDQEVVLRITDKTELYRVARSLGLEVPRTAVVDRGSLDALRESDFPVIVKPVRSARAGDGGTLVRVDAQLIASHRELRALLDRLGADQWLIQPRIDGQLGAISGVASQGDVVVAVHQRSRRVWPPGAGVSAFAETVQRDPALEADVGRLMRAMSWSGIFQAQFIHCDGQAHLIDINPRVYGSLALATAAGVNLPATWAGVVTGSPIERPAYRAGVRYRSDELDVRALLHMAMNGHPVAAAAGMLPRRNTTHSVIALRDPAPVLTTVAKLRRRRSVD